MDLSNVSDLELLKEVCKRFEWFACSDSIGCIELHSEMPVNCMNDYYSSDNGSVHCSHVKKGIGRMALIDDNGNVLHEGK